MGLDLKEWNAINGLSSTLLRNLAVGIIMLLVCALAYLLPAYIRLSMVFNEHMESDIEYYRHEKIRSDSTKQLFWKYYYSIKSEKEK